MALEERFSQLSIWTVNLWFKSYAFFAYILSYTGIYMCGSGSVLGIRIHKAPEYRSNTDPDPQHWEGEHYLGLYYTMSLQSNQDHCERCHHHHTFICFCLLK